MDKKFTRRMTLFVTIEFALLGVVNLYPNIMTLLIGYGIIVASAQHLFKDYFTEE